MILHLLDDGFDVHVRVEFAGFQANGVVQSALVILDQQACDPAVEVAEFVGQVGVADIDKPLPAELAVAREWTFPHEVKPERLGAKLGDQIHWFNDIAECFTDLLHDPRFFIFDVDKAVAEDAARRLDAGSHAHCRPQCAMKARDVLANDVQSGGPPLVESSFVRPVADGRDVVQQRVEPHPDGEVRVERHADAPGLAGARDVHVAQFRLYQAEHFIAAALRLDEVGVLFIETNELFLELRQREIVTRLRAPHRGGLMNGTVTVLVEILVGFETLAALAIPPLVTALVDVAVVEHLLDELAAAFVMAGLARLDEIVVADLQGAPDLLKLPGHVVAIGFRIDAQLGGALGDLDGVLVVAHEEEHVVALHAAIARLYVRAELFEGGADMRPAVGVIDGCGQKIARWFGHDETILPTGGMA